MTRDWVYTFLAVHQDLSSPEDLVHTAHDGQHFGAVSILAGTAGLISHGVEVDTLGNVVSRHELPETAVEMNICIYITNTERYQCCEKLGLVTDTVAGRQQAGD